MLPAKAHPSPCWSYRWLPLLPALLKAFKQMNFSITAEGIETEEMADALREIGCDYFQGYYFSRPLPMEEFLQLAS